MKGGATSSGTLMIAKLTPHTRTTANRPASGGSETRGTAPWGDPPNVPRTSARPRRAVGPHAILTMSTGIRKLYYSIREVSEMTGLKPHVLRYWESEFDALRPKKNRAGNRAYTEPDIAVVRRIQALVHDDKYTLEGARQVMDEPESGRPRVAGGAPARAPPGPPCVFGGRVAGALNRPLVFSSRLAETSGSGAAR